MQFQPPELTAVWQEVKTLLEQGFSIIPVRERAEGSFSAKSPYAGWKEYQTNRMTADQLWFAMTERFNTNAIAFICGAVSGNLEVIDIDNKNKPGIETSVFQSIKELFPDVWEKLRIHKSPSGGYHILYRVSGGAVPGNKKLASVDADPKPKCFLETRGEGGIILVPPSLGYSVYKATAELPIITWEERCAIIGVCNGFDEVRKVEEITPTIREKREDYYEENPFEHFNKSSDGETALVLGGWKMFKSTNQYLYFTRPGGTDRTIHAAFLKAKRLFYFFSTNTEFDADRCYQPATVLSIILHAGDKKKTYLDLVHRGFGKIRPEVERRIVSRAGSNGATEPPANLSPANKEAYVEAIRDAAAKYPYGVFWRVDGDENVVVERELLYRVAASLGFRYDPVTVSILRIRENVIHNCTTRYFYDTMKSYIKDASIEILNAYEAFLQRSGKFTMERIEMIDESKILNDTRTICYKFYEDIFVSITKDGYNEHNYSELKAEQLIWKSQIQDRKLRTGDGGRFVEFLEKAVEYEKRETYIQGILGYLSHNYKDETTGYMPVLVEQCEDPKNGGGSGKNVFCNLLKLTTTVTGVPGSQVKYDQNLLQSWNGEKIFVVSDCPKDFKYDFFKDLSTDDTKVKKLYVNEAIIPMHRMPKFIFQTNFSYDISDGGLKRRLRQLEFTDFFTKTGGIDAHFGIHFPRGWTVEDWAGYDGTIIRSIQVWLGSNLKIVSATLTDGGWRKQFEITNGRTCYDFVKENFEKFCELGSIKNDDFKKVLIEFYEEKNIPKIYQPTMNRINKAFDDYAVRHGYIFQADIKIRENGLQYKGKSFLRQEDDAPF